jgi:hypothetical protein
MSSAAAAAAAVAQQHSSPITAFSDEHIRRSSSSSQGQAPQQHQAQAPAHLRVQQLQHQGSGITVSRSGSEVEDMDADEVLPIDCGTPRSPIAPVMVDTSDMRRFLMAPGPREGPVQCYILRDKGSSRMYPRWGPGLLLLQCCWTEAGLRGRGAHVCSCPGMMKGPARLCTASNVLGHGLLAVPVAQGQTPRRCTLQRSAPGPRC